MRRVFSLLLLGAQATPQDCNGCHSVDLARFETTVHADCDSPPPDGYPCSSLVDFTCCARKTARSH